MRFEYGYRKEIPSLVVSMVMTVVLLPILAWCWLRDR